MLSLDSLVTLVSDYSTTHFNGSTTISEPSETHAPTAQSSKWAARFVSAPMECYFVGPSTTVAKSDSQSSTENAESSGVMHPLGGHLGKIGRSVGYWPRSLHSDGYRVYLVADDSKHYCY